MKHNSTHETLLARWIEGTITPEESEILAKMEGIQELEGFLSSFDEGDLPPMDMDAAWDKLAQKTIHTKKTIKPKHSNLRPMLLRIAAAVALIVGVGFWYTINVVPQKFYAAAGSTEQVTLPDGSLVTLNAGSSLQYSKWNWKHNRSVKLQGEAFFKVAKGQKFTVKTAHGETSVLGTQFDILDRKNTFQVKCFEGRVQVNSANKASILSKGKGVKIVNNTIKKMDFHATNPAWLNGQSKFFENSLQEVFDEMKRQYILQIDANDINVLKQFTGVLPNRNLEKALAIVCGSMNLSYEISDDKKQIKISAK